MEPLIKIDLKKELNANMPVVIELGCGKKKNNNRITFDKLDLRNVDIVADLEHGLPFIPDKSVDKIYCKSVLEHIRNF